MILNNNDNNILRKGLPVCGKSPTEETTHSAALMSHSAAVRNGGQNFRTVLKKKKTQMSKSIGKVAFIVQILDFNYIFPVEETPN